MPEDPRPPAPAPAPTDAAPAPAPAPTPTPPLLAGRADEDDTPVARLRELPVVDVTPLTAGRDTAASSGGRVTPPLAPWPEPPATALAASVEAAPRKLGLLERVGAPVRRPADNDDADDEDAAVGVLPPKDDDDEEGRVPDPAPTPVLIVHCPDPDAADEEAEDAVGVLPPGRAAATGAAVRDTVPIDAGSAPGRAEIAKRDAPAPAVEGGTPAAVPGLRNVDDADVAGIPGRCAAPLLVPNMAPYHTSRAQAHAMGG
jgi:hypothetical protein